MKSNFISKAMAAAAVASYHSRMERAPKDIDAELIARLNQLQLRDIQTVEPVSPSSSCDIQDCVGADPEPTKTRTKPKKRGGKKRRSGYQCFVSREFSWAKKDLATWKSVPERLIPSQRVFCELGRRWRSFSQLDREAWVAAAAGDGPTPPAWRCC